VYLYAIKLNIKLNYTEKLTRRGSSSASKAHQWRGSTKGGAPSSCQICPAPGLNNAARNVGNNESQLSVRPSLDFCPHLLGVLRLESFRPGQKTWLLSLLHWAEGSFK